MSSKSIYTFKPTFLYIKQHTVTGKLYFGKTVQDPEKYIGSGKYWTNHIKKYGKEHVVNLWYCLFYNQQDCQDFALQFSKNHNIVESSDWANQATETGLGGWAPDINLGKSPWNKGIFGHKQSEETKKKKSEYMLANNPFKNKTHNEETKQKQRKAKLGKSCKNKGHIGITDGINQRFIPRTSKIPDGWYIGGLPKSQATRDKMKGNTSANSTPVTINNVTYPSKNAAVRELGLKSKYHLEKLLR